MKKLLSSVILLILSVFTVTQLNAQSPILNRSKCEEFLASGDLYIINTTYSLKTYVTSGGESFRFYDLVCKAWPDKKIHEIEESEYSKKKDVKDCFYIMMDYFSVDVSNSSVIYIQKSQQIIMGMGKYDIMNEAKSHKNKFVAINLSLLEMSAKDAVLCERMIYAVETIRYSMEHFTTTGFGVPLPATYQTEGYEKYLNTHTLYIREDFLDPKYQDKDKIAEVYPYPFKIVSYAAWLEAFTQKDKSVIIVDGRGPTPNFTDGIYGFEIYSAADGRIIFINTIYMYKNYKIDKSVLSQFKPD